MGRLVATSFVALTVGAVVLRLWRSAPSCFVQPNRGCYIFVGTYTQPGAGNPPNIDVQADDTFLGKGIYALWIDLSTGALTVNGCLETDGLANPSYVAMHPYQNVMYSVSEVPEHGRVSAHTIEEENGNLIFRDLSCVDSLGGLPCHLIVDRAASNLVCSNYLDGSVTLIPLSSDGTLGEGFKVQNAGDGPNSLRQEGPHAHSVAFDALQQKLYSVDLGADSIFERDWPLTEEDAALEKLQATLEAALAAPLQDAKLDATLEAALEKLDAEGVRVKRHHLKSTGVGPRHMVMHPGGSVAYVICEMTGRVLVLDVDNFEQIEEYDVLPPDADVVAPDGTRAWAADLVLAPSGRYLYASARIHDIIACFKVSEDGRSLSRFAIEKVGKTPRSMALTRDGRFLVAAYQHSDLVESFNVHHDNGQLRRTGSRVVVPKPVSVCPWQ